jgi:hypothetical protein
MKREHVSLPATQGLEGGLIYAVVGASANEGMMR